MHLSKLEYRPASARPERRPSSSYRYHRTRRVPPMPEPRMSVPAANALRPNDLEAYWMPFTANRAFKQSPPLWLRPRTCIISRRKAARFSTGRRACGAPMRDTAARDRRGHPSASGGTRFRAAISIRAPKGVRLASRVAALAPADLDHVFFTNSGSEAVDTALKIALAYHNIRGEGARQRLIDASAAITASASAAPPSAAWSQTGKFSAIFSPASIICLQPTIAPSRPSQRASRVGRASR